ncbi:hypothetical protein ACHQM5_017397 [Ranunculus cassubicifolius]
MESTLEHLTGRMDEMNNKLDQFGSLLDQLFEAFKDEATVLNGHKEFISTIPAHNTSNGHKEFFSTIPVQKLSPSDYMLAGDLGDETELSDTDSVPAQSDNSAPVTQQKVAITMAHTGTGLDYSADSGIEEYLSLLSVKLPGQINLQFSHLLALDIEHYIIACLLVWLLVLTTGI